MITLVLRYSEPSSRLIRNYLFFCGGWLLYILTVQQLGLLENFELPPRIPLLVVIPLIVLMIWFTSTRKFRPVLTAAPSYLPVVLQSFRVLVELLIFGAFVEEVFPERVTFKGLNFDILVGLSALPVAYLISRNLMGKSGILAWNIVSLMILGLTVFSFIYSYYFTDYLLTGSKELVHFPYLLLPSVLLPIAVLLHVVSIRQALKAKH